jgi:hypothetical protein
MYVCFGNLEAGFVFYVKKDLGKVFLFLKTEQFFLLRRRRRHPMVAGHRAGVMRLAGEDEYSSSCS